MSLVTITLFSGHFRTLYHHLEQQQGNDVPDTEPHRHQLLLHSRMLLEWHWFGEDALTDITLNDPPDETTQQLVETVSEEIEEALPDGLSLHDILAIIPLSKRGSIMVVIST